MYEVVVTYEGKQSPSMDASIRSCTTKFGDSGYYFGDTPEESMRDFEWEFEDEAEAVELKAKIDQLGFVGVIAIVREMEDFDDEEGE